MVLDEPVGDSQEGAASATVRAAEETNPSAPNQTESETTEAGSAQVH